MRLVAGAIWAGLLVALPVRAVELMVEGEALEPATTLEVRFEEDQVTREQLGVPVVDSPLVIEPALPGSFVWLSRRSGVFTPSEPPRLGTKYRVTLRDGLPGELDRTLTTPPFQIAKVQDDSSEGIIPAQPSTRLAFNLEVDLPSASDKFGFVSDDGQTVPGVVEFMKSNDYFSVPAAEGDWMKRWSGAEKVTTPSPDGEEAPARTMPERLMVQPARLLGAGPKWRLEMKPGLKSANGVYTLETARTFPLGVVEAFVVESVAPTSYVNTGRSVTIEFSDPVGPDVEEETFQKFVKIEPEVPELALEADYTSFVLRGKFDRDRNYTLTLDPSLLSNTTQPLSGERTFKFRFGPVKPRVYLPEFTGRQIAEGRREFLVRSVNLSALKVKALLIDPAATAKSLVAFQDYRRKWNAPGADVEPYQALPPDAVPGRLIYEKTIPIPDPKLDAAQTTTLNWDDLLGARRTGGVLLTVEGVALAEAGESRPPAAQSIIQLTDLGVLWKQVEDSLQLRLFSMQNAAPVAEVWAFLLDEKFGQLATATTDAAGEGTLPITAEPAWLVVEKGEDVFAQRMGAEADELPMAGFELPIYYRGWGPQASGKVELRGLIFTDRPLYQPGETVRVKGIIRRVIPGGLAWEAGRTGTLTVSPPRGDNPMEIAVQTDERGAFDTEALLDPTVVGAYTVSLQLNDIGTIAFERFQVGDYEPDAFELKLEAPDRLAPGEKVAAEVSGRYLFGSAINGARLQWTLQSAPTSFSPDGFGKFSFAQTDRSEQKTLTLRGESDLDESARVEPRLPAPEDMPQRNTLTVEVTDLNQQTVSATRTFTRDASDFYLGISTGSTRVVGIGNPVSGAVVAVDPNGQPLTKPVTVEATLVREIQRTVRVVGAGGAVSFSTDKTDEEVAKMTGKTIVPQQVDDVWQTGDGETFRFQPKAPGSYRIEVTAKDDGGRRVRSVKSIYVAGEGEVAWDYRHPYQIDLRPDRLTYRVGDTAKILVKSPFTGTAMVTVERRNRILRQQQVTLAGNAPTIEIQIEPGDGPNVFVSLMLIRGTETSTRKFKMPEYRYGVCQLAIENPETELQVAIRPAKPDVMPGDEVVSVVQVNGMDGAPVADAEVTFYAVDDGVLALVGFERPDPGAIFGAPYPLNIRTGISLSDLLAEDPADLEFGNKGYLIGGGGLDGPGPKIRRDFPGTATWQPSLRTGADGTVLAKFAAPDALTRYRLVAVVSAGADRFGSAESSIAIKKPVMLLSAVPPVAHVGDTLTARAVVRNESGRDDTVKVSLQLDQHAEAVGEALEVEFPLANGAARTVDLPVRIREMGDARWVWSAVLGEGVHALEDRVETKLRLDSPAPLLRETYLSELSEKTNDLLAGVNPQVLDGTGLMTVTLSNTRLANLRAASDYLLEYPYDCAEQQISSLVPWLTSADLRPFLPEGKRGDDEVKETIRGGVAKIMALQTPSGGLSYWPGGKAQLFPSAWAVIALSRVKPSPARWDELIAYLGQELRGTAKETNLWSLEDRVFAAYALALAGEPESAYHEVLYKRRAELSHESRALLALTFLLGGEKGDPVATLLDPRVPASEGISWFGDASRERAIQLMAWSRYRPRDREVGRLVAELLQGRRRHGAWNNTQSNAWSVLALADYFSRVEGKLRPVSATLHQAGQAFPIELTTEQLSVSTPFDFAPPTGPGPLTAENPKQRNLYGETRFEVRPPLADQPRQDRGYSVSRTYQKLGADGKLSAPGELKVGDRLLVTLRVETPVPGHFVAIDDPLPAILEAVNPVFQTKAVGGGSSLTNAAYSDYREIRADRVVYFRDHLPAGAHVFRYLARVRAAGDVIAPATKAEEMYRPERFGLSATDRLQSSAAK